MKDRIVKSQAIRLDLLRKLFETRLDQPGKPWIWRRDLEQHVGSKIDFEIGYLVERGDIAEDGPKYRITAQGIDHMEART